MRIHDLYSALPAPLQDAACSAYGYRLNSRRYSGSYHRVERDVHAREWWPLEQLTGFVNGRLHRVVEHAAKSVPYYRKLFADSHIDHRDIRTVADLAMLPLLDKRTVQERSSEFISERSHELRCTSVHTSGT